MYIEADENLQEKIPYSNSNFPMDIWVDVYNLFQHQTVNCHWHEDFELGVVLSGEVDYYISETHILLREGDCIFVNSNTMHMGKQCEGCHNAVMFTINFPAILFTGNMNHTIYTKYFYPIKSRGGQGFQVSQNTVAGRGIKKALLDIFDLDSDVLGYELLCMGLLNQLWYFMHTYIMDLPDFLSADNPDTICEDRVKGILSYIHKNFSTRLTVQEIAQSAGISRSECFRCFKQFTNKNPVKYMNEYRLAQTVKLLLETNDSITEICMACGFASSSYFGKLFKESYGISPFQFRQRGLEIRKRPLAVAKSLDG